MSGRGSWTVDAPRICSFYCSCPRTGPTLCGFRQLCRPYLSSLLLEVLFTSPFALVSTRHCSNSEVCSLGGEGKCQVDNPRGCFKKCRLDLPPESSMEKSTKAPKLRGRKGKGERKYKPWAERGGWSGKGPTVVLLLTAISTHVYVYVCTEYSIRIRRILPGGSTPAALDSIARRRCRPSEAVSTRASPEEVTIKPSARLQEPASGRLRLSATFLICSHKRARSNYWVVPGQDQWLVGDCNDNNCGKVPPNARFTSCLRLRTTYVHQPILLHRARSLVGDSAWRQFMLVLALPEALIPVLKQNGVQTL